MHIQYVDPLTQVSHTCELAYADIMAAGELVYQARSYNRLANQQSRSQVRSCRLTSKPCRCSLGFVRLWLTAVALPIFRASA
jgi:hypothetical protein